jgi:hypothetical protein
MAFKNVSATAVVKWWEVNRWKKISLYLFSVDALLRLFLKSLLKEGTKKTKQKPLRYSRNSVPFLMKPAWKIRVGTLQEKSNLEHKVVK